MPDNEAFPTREIDDYIQRRLYISESESKTDPFHFDNTHLQSPEIQQIRQIFQKYPRCVSTPDNPLGKFKLFQAGISLMPGRISAQTQENNSMWESLPWHREITQTWSDWREY